MMMKKRSSRYNSDTAEMRRQSFVEQDEDISLLQRPLRTAFTGFQEAKRAYEDGTSEVRRLLLKECSLIYECNVCRNMFRSLANFISHKRVFCVNTASAGYYNGFTDQNSTVIIQQATAHTPDIDSMKRSRSTGSSPVPIQSHNTGAVVRGSMRDLSHVIERLRREKAPEADLNSCQQANNVNATVIQLESVPTSKQAVYQTLKKRDCDSIKTEVQEVHQLLKDATYTKLGPDGKAMQPSAEDLGVGKNDATQNDRVKIKTEANKIMCDKCNLEFQTEKTLKIHIQKNHSLSSYVFQCPACSLTFLQPAAVIRHLSKEHKKPTRRIRLMRDSILKRRIQQGDATTKGPNRELKRLQMSDVKSEQLVAYGTEQRKVMSTCIYCEKSFERRAALSTHLLNCRAKQKALQNPAPPVKRLRQLKQQEDETGPTNDTNKSNLESNSKDTNIKRIKQVIGEAANQELNLLFERLSDKPNSNTELHTVSLDKAQSEAEDSEDSTKAELANDETQDSNDITGNTSDLDQSKFGIIHASTERNNNSNTTKEADITSGNKKKQSRSAGVEKLMKCRCKICNKNFNALSNVRRHISMFHYRAHRFGCKICDYRAFRRYDIVNHLGFVHKLNGEREALALEFVTTFECQYTKNDIDGDILLLGKEGIVKAKSPCLAITTVSESMDDLSNKKKRPKVLKTYEKRVKRKKQLEEKPVEDEALPKVEAVTTAQNSSKKNLRRSRSQHGIDDSLHSDNEKRPIRKRVKAENKDFVYDMSRLSKNEGNSAGTLDSNAETQLQRPKRRTLTGVESDTIAATFVSHEVSEQRITRATAKPQWAPLITDSNKRLVQGSVRRIMLQLVSQGMAVSSTLPELPAVRPQIRPRLISAARAIEPPVCVPSSVIEKVKLEDEPVVLRPKLNDSFIEKIAQRTGLLSAASNNKTATKLLVESNKKLKPIPQPAPTLLPIVRSQREPPAAACAPEEFNVATLGAPDPTAQPVRHEHFSGGHSELFEANMYSAIPGHVYAAPQKFTTPTPSSPPYPPPPLRPHYNYLTSTAADPVPSLTLTMESLLRSALQN